MKDKTLKYLITSSAAVAIYGLWFALIILGKTDVEPFINALMVAVGGGGVHLIHINNSETGNEPKK